MAPNPSLRLARFGKAAYGCVRGAAMAGGLTLGDIASRQAQAHDHPPTPGSENASPMILGSKELVEYGQRSRYVTSVRIQHPPGGRPSPDLFGKVFHVASPLQD